MAMSNSDISSWVTSSSSLGPDEDSDHQNEWQKDRVLGHWPAAMEFAQRVLLKDRTKIRIAFLRNDILPLAKHAGEDVFDFPCLLELMPLDRPFLVTDLGCF